MKLKKLTHYYTHYPKSSKRLTSDGSDANMFKVPTHDHNQSGEYDIISIFEIPRFRLFAGGIFQLGTDNKMRKWVKDVNKTSQTSIFNQNHPSPNTKYHMIFDEFSPKEIRCGVIVGRFEYAITSKRSPYAVIKTTEKLYIFNAALDQIDHIADAPVDEIDRLFLFDEIAFIKTQNEWLYFDCYEKNLLILEENFEALIEGNVKEFGLINQHEIDDDDYKGKG